MGSQVRATGAIRFDSFLTDHVRNDGFDFPPLDSPTIPRAPHEPKNSGARSRRHAAHSRSPNRAAASAATPLISILSFWLRGNSSTVMNRDGIA